MFRFICLLPLLASALPASESRSAPIESLQSADKIQEVLCAKQVGDYLAQQSVPDGVERVVNKVKELFPDVEKGSEVSIIKLVNLGEEASGNTHSNYEPVGNLSDACTEAEEILKGTRSNIHCFESFTDYPAIVKANEASLPVLEAVFACKFNNFRATREVLDMLEKTTVSAGPFRRRRPAKKAKGKNNQ